MSRVLLTGMSGSGKTTLLSEMASRGHFAIDIDYDGWVVDDCTWDEVRMDQLLAERAEVVVSGTVQNQGRFYDRFDLVILLSAPLSVLLERVKNRTTNPMDTVQSSRPGLPHTLSRWSRCFGTGPPWNSTPACRQGN